ncbi:MAG: hypothetical protein AAEJ47_00910, partial [Planctomycetota bacterium]
MNKSILLGLVLALMVPAVALADGVTVNGDVRLRWEYAGAELGGLSASTNDTNAVLNIGIGGTVSESIGYTASLRHAM